MIATDRKFPSLPVYTCRESAQHFVQTEIIIMNIIYILYNNQRRLKPCIEQMLMHNFWMMIGAQFEFLFFYLPGLFDNKLAGKLKESPFKNIC